MNLKYESNLAKMVLSIFVVCTILMGQSCSESVSVNLDEPHLISGLDSASVLQLNEYQFLDKKYKLPSGITKWEAQLDKMIENNQLLMRNGLKLVSYKYVRNVVSVSDLETVKCQMNGDRSFFVVYNKDSITNFTIGQNEAVSKNYIKFLNYLMPTSDSSIVAKQYKNDTSSLANSVYFFEKNDMEIVDLTWQYKGKTIYTACLVSKRKGFIFDKILSAIPFIIKNDIEVVSSATPKIHLKSTPPPPPDGPLSCSDTPNNMRLSMTGDVLWSYNIKVTLHGQRTAGVKYAMSPETSYNTKALGPDDPAHYFYGTWDCKASVQIIDFVQGPEGYLRYAYAWSYVCNGIVSLSWNGAGFVFTGGGTTGGGQRDISVNDLN